MHAKLYSDLLQALMKYLLIVLDSHHNICIRGNPPRRECFEFCSPTNVFNSCTVPCILIHVRGPVSEEAHRQEMKMRPGGKIGGWEENDRVWEVQRRVRGSVEEARCEGGRERWRKLGGEVLGQSWGTKSSQGRETSSPIPSSSLGPSARGPSAKEIAWDDFPYLRNL